jgi:hypothetical protein
MNMTSKNMFCEFITIDNRTYECKNCGLIITVQDSISSAPVFPCRQSLSREDVSEITFAQKIKNFANATVKHIQNGLPICTEEQIIKRHNICIGCDFFQNNTCQKCGCPIIRNKMFASKLAWADQACPINKWGSEI